LAEAVEAGEQQRRQQERGRHSKEGKEGGQQQQQHHLSLIRNCSAALLPAVAARVAAAWPGAAVLPTYGMTECLPICAHPLGDGGGGDGDGGGGGDGRLSAAITTAAAAAAAAAAATTAAVLRRPGSVGPAAGPEVAIMRVRDDRLGRPVAWAEVPWLPVVTERDGNRGETETEPYEGEVVCRGLCQMRGYEEEAEEEEAAAAVRQEGSSSVDSGSGEKAGANAATWLGKTGWMRTGDKGWMDSDGHVFLSGRFKEIVNRCAPPLVSLLAAFNCGPSEHFFVVLVWSMVVRPSVCPSTGRERRSRHSRWSRPCFRTRASTR
jgi:acyl-CoA synthetase (AMP-forming)/AMP-acid ligase II